VKGFIVINDPSTPCCLPLRMVDLSSWVAVHCSSLSRELLSLSALFRRQVPPLLMIPFLVLLFFVYLLPVKYNVSMVMVGMQVVRLPQRMMILQILSPLPLYQISLCSISRELQTILKPTPTSFSYTRLNAHWNPLT
jgi:hypothetical protein